MFQVFFSFAQLEAAEQIRNVNVLSPKYHLTLLVQLAARLWLSCLHVESCADSTDMNSAFFLCCTPS